MRCILITLALCATVSQAFAGCRNEETINAFGHTFASGGLIGMMTDSGRDCDARDQPAWIAKINETAPADASRKSATSNAAPAQTYCREIVRNKDPQYDSQRRDCVFWYGHSIEVQ